MMLKRSLLLGVVVVCVLSLIGMTNAATALTHVGYADPASEGWTLDSYGTGIVGGGTDTENYWRTQTDASAKRRYLSGNVSAITGNSTGWTMTAMMKLIAGPGFNDAEFTVYDGASGWEMSIMSDGVWSVAPSWGQGARLASLNPTLAYHTYQMVFDPAGNGGSGTVSYYIDGVYASASKRSDVISYGGLYRAEFGDQSDGNPWASDSQWSYVSLEAGQHVVPEPCMLLVLGMGGIAALRRRKTV